MFKKIVTHAGVFHSDEIVGVTLAMILSKGAKVERTFNPSTEDIADKDVCVLDIGRAFDPCLNNFDHHIDENLDCAALELYKSKKKHFDKNMQKAIESFLEGVNAQDLGIANNGEGYMSMSHVISSFNPLVGVNSDEGFYEAIEFVVTIIRRKALFFAQQESFKRIAEEAIKHSYLKCAFTENFNPALKDLCIEVDVNFTCQPGERGGFMLTCVPPKRGSFAQKKSIDKELAIDCGASFVHNAKFCASFPEEDNVREYLEYVNIARI